MNIHPELAPFGSIMLKMTGPISKDIPGGYAEEAPVRKNETGSVKRGPRTQERNEDHETQVGRAGTGAKLPSLEIAKGM